MSEADIAALGHGSPPRAKRVLKAYERQLRDGGDAEGFPCEARELRLCEIFHGGPVSWPPHEPEHGLPAHPTVSLVAVELHVRRGCGRAMQRTLTAAALGRIGPQAFGQVRGLAAWEFQLRQREAYVQNLTGSCVVGSETPQKNARAACPWPGGRREFGCIAKSCCLRPPRRTPGKALAADLHACTMAITSNVRNNTLKKSWGEFPALAIYF